MFNEYNIRVFDFIYSVNCEKVANGYIDNEEKCKQEINNIIKELGIEPYDFWTENKVIVQDKTILDTTTLDGKSFVYLMFPNMKLSSKSKYLEYKAKQLERIIEDNPNYNFKLENLKKDFNVKSLIGIKEIIDKCIEYKIIISNEEYWYEIPNTKYGRIDEDKLKVNMNKNIEKINKTEIKAENIIVMNDRSKINKSDFSKNKKEIEKESLVSKIFKSLKNLFKWSK